ncbi:MAG TPA: ABC transporter permease subunit [Clostridiales bacterium]|nr:ABC transporter permease subunit [Clostridiales bacterium]
MDAVKHKKVIVDFRWNTLWKEIKKTKYLQLMLIPAIIWYIIFCYGPMYGVTIAFKDFNMRIGILNSPFVGFKHFERFITHPYFWKLMRNTVLLSCYSLIFSFPIPIVFALLLNEVRNIKFKKFVQTVSYLPHFISTVAIVGMIVMMLSPSSGFINKLLTSWFEIEPIYFMSEQCWFRPIYIISGIWQSTGWNAIIYLAALSSIDQELYEAISIDGGGRFRKIWHITLPGIKPTIVILFILGLGSMLSVGSEKIILMYSPITYEVADVVSTFVYRVGLFDAQYSYSTAVGLMNSIVNVILLTIANRMARKFADFSLW